MALWAWGLVSRVAGSGARGVASPVPILEVE